MVYPFSSILSTYYRQLSKPIHPLHYPSYLSLGSSLALPLRPPNFPYTKDVRFYTPKWQRRLKRILETSHYPPPPNIPSFEVFSKTSSGQIISSSSQPLTSTSATSDLIPLSKQPTKAPHPLIPFRSAFCPPKPLPSPLLKSLPPIWRSRRVGLLAYKLGCIGVWNEWGERICLTVCQVDRCSVLEVKTIPTHGYEAVVMGCGYQPLHQQSKPNIGRFMKAKTGPKQHIKEFKCTSDALLPVGHEMSVRHFAPGQWVFVSGWTKAKGFMGVMKRWGFAGGQKSHGTEHKAHSAAGSISQGKSVNIVWKFKKMAGHHGPDPRVVNCKVFRIESERNLIFLTGAIPGSQGSLIKISDARGKTCVKNRGLSIPFPTFIPKFGENYPVTVQLTPSKEDPFALPDVPVYEHS